MKPVELQHTGAGSCILSERRRSFSFADKGRGAALRLSPQRFSLPDGKTLRVITVFYWISFAFLSL